MVVDPSRAILEREEIVVEPWRVVWISVERSWDVEICVVVVVCEVVEEEVMVRKDFLLVVVVGRKKAVAE